jgi:hypothetical protein
MLRRSSGIAAVALMLSGCASQGVNPCDLLSLEEAQAFEPDIKGSVWHPAATSRAGDNELCVWHDGADENLLMLFYFPSSAAHPADLVASGMSGREMEIIDIEGVGESASAGFGAGGNDTGGRLGLFAARANGKTIGLRTRNINSVTEEKFQHLRRLASTVLARI